MPCLFLRNVPANITFQPMLVQQFHRDLADADGGEFGSFEIHIEYGRYDLLMPDGSLQRAPNVHVFVEGHARPLEVKREIAILTDQFLKAHGIGEGTDITFRDSPAETFFLNGRLFKGGPLRR